MFVGFFRGLQNLGSRPVPDESASEGLSLLLHGRENYALEVVGSARRQAEIRAIATGKIQAGRRQKRLAALSLGQDERTGVTKVGVFMEGAMIGYFPRYLTTQYCEWLRAWNLSRANVHCHALILRDGNGAEGRAGEYRVKLDIEIPFKMTTLQF